MGRDLIAQAQSGMCVLSGPVGVNCGSIII
jgi:hypothetical protein